jgi:hypothetical protein
MITVSKALTYINDVHCGYLAFACEDGLVVRSEMVDTCKDVGELPEYARYALIGSKMDGKLVDCKYYDADRVEEDFEVFPIVDGMVSLKAIRDHMGY